MTLEQFRWTVIVLAMAIAFMFMASCGTRKVNQETNINQQSSYQKNEGSGSNALNSNTSINSSITQNNDKLNESQSRKIREIYSENGSLKERITELLNTKSIDKSTTITKVVTVAKMRLLQKYWYRDITKNEITTIYKTRIVDRDSTWVANIGGIWGILGIAFMIIVAVFLYFYLTKK